MRLLTAASLFTIAVAAIPDPIAKRDPPAPTAPWVEVNDDGQPSTTYTPSATVVSGTTSIVDAAPHDLTATVYTEKDYFEMSTRTGDPPNPSPTAEKGDQGAFTRCYNMDGKNAPFCAPAENSTLYENQRYYVTFDPDFYNITDAPASLNTTVEITLRLDYYNTSSSSWTKLTELDHHVPAKWGYYAFKASDKWNKEHKSTNLTIKLIASMPGSKEKNVSEVALPVVLTQHQWPTNKDPSAPTGKTLYIAIPAVFGAIILLVIGVCLWNRKTRRIQLGNVMGRSNRGYTGRRTRQMFSRRNHKDEEISLDVRSVGDGPVGGGEYHDEPQVRMTDYDEERDARGGFRDEQTVGGGNAFRDEIDRQNRQRQER